MAWKEQPLANSMKNAKYKVIDLMSDQVDVDKKGGTMRLGIYPCKVEAGTKTRKLMAKI